MSAENELPYLKDQQPPLIYSSMICVKEMFVVDGFNLSMNLSLKVLTKG